MAIRDEKARRLEEIARMYYEKDMTQGDIAKKMGVSRPLISRMLQEARDYGIVEIRIHTPNEGDALVLNQAKNIFGLRGGVLLPEAVDNNIANENLARAAMEYIRELGAEHLGLGWGHIIGVMVSLYEKKEPKKDLIQHVCPMVGNGGISIRNYHSNENVRIVAHHTMAQPHYLHTPAFAETRQERELLQQTENFKAIMREWEKLDVALVNIGNHPSTPDFASVARYGDLLTKRRAAGRMIAYYFNEEGEIIHSDTDYVIQIPLSVLAKCRNVVGICSFNTSRKALHGALNTGLITHLVAREQLVREVLEARRE